MRTTNKVFKAQIQEHVLERLCTDYTEDPKQQLEGVINEFKSWYSPYEKKRTPNRYEAMKEFLLGLPSCLDVEYTYYNISQTLKNWYENVGETYKQNDSDKEAIWYYHLVIRELFNLCNKYKVETF